MSGVEYADGHRGTSPFPTAWGIPPRDEMQRRRWVHMNATRAMASAPPRGRLSGVRAMAQLRDRMLEARRVEMPQASAPLALLVELQRRRWDPAA
ncbi:MAG TPA: hypothetical protein VFB74_15095 [Kribbellaceae bacterium]|nr:hypothetical protein [Kribbellaceae bacterium]